MNGDVLARLYHRLGPRYLRVVLVVALRVPHLVLVVGVGVVALYVHMSLAEFALLALAAVGLQEIYSLFTLRYFRPRLAPIVAWLHGERSEGPAGAAWRAAASLPFEAFRLWWRGGYPLVADLAWALLATWVLG